MIETSGIDVSRWLYAGLIGLVVAQRLAELALARRNTARARARGGLEVGQGHYPWMVALHSAFLLSCLLEVFLLERPWITALAAAMLTLLLLASALRVWTIRTLGERWTTRVITVPGERAVRSGPFHYFRHPNYLAVTIEIFALPLVHGAWLTAAIFSIANGVLLRARIRTEEAALARHGDYRRIFHDVPSFPGTDR